MEENIASSSKNKKKKKKKHKKVEEPSNPEAIEEPIADPNSISISDAETESWNEHENDNDKNDPPDEEEEEEASDKRCKNKRYNKEDFIARRHGKEREPWVQKPMPFPGKSSKSKEEEHYN